MLIPQSSASTSVVLFLLVIIKIQGLKLSPETVHESHQGEAPTATKSIIQQSPTCPASFIPFPKGTPRIIPQIQHQFGPESESDRLERIKRQQTVKAAFQHSWDGYKSHAWFWDEVSPISGGHQSPLGGWRATLIDSLDTLLIMDLNETMEKAIECLHDIDFSTSKSPKINVFETTIRYLGGLISAYELTDGKYSILLEKAQELTEFLYGAFDNPNGMPHTRWQWIRTIFQSSNQPSEPTLLAEIGSLSLEFTRLSQITGDHTYFDAVQRITDNLQSTQNQTRLPGLWPLLFDAHALNLSDSYFTVGGMADSAYEYLVKEYLLLEGRSNQYRDMYISAVEGIRKHLLFRGMYKDREDILFAGNVRFDPGSEEGVFEYQMEHLKCFLGGMLGLGSRVFGRSDDLSIARELVNGCIWAYDFMPTGIMPETLYISGCRNTDHCELDEERWFRGIFGWPEGEQMPVHLREATRRIIQEHGLQPPVLEFADPKYRLRPEAIESIFVMYRITGEKSLQDAAWRMFQNIERYTKVQHGYAALNDTRDKGAARLDVMESFWLSETLKYFYLIFSDPKLISLDEYVFNTEGHPFKYAYIPPTSEDPDLSTL